MQEHSNTASQQRYESSFQSCRMEILQSKERRQPTRTESPYRGHQECPSRDGQELEIDSGGESGAIGDPRQTETDREVVQQHKGEADGTEDYTHDPDWKTWGVRILTAMSAHGEKEYGECSEFECGGDGKHPLPLP